MITKSVVDPVLDRILELLDFVYNTITLQAQDDLAEERETARDRLRRMRSSGASDAFITDYVRNSMVGMIADRRVVLEGEMVR